MDHRIWVFEDKEMNDVEIHQIACGHDTISESYSHRGSNYGWR